jgi:hypothetical protein
MQSDTVLMFAKRKRNATTPRETRLTSPRQELHSLNKALTEPQKGLNKASKEP